MTHILVRDRDLSVFCTRCGKRMRLELPVSVDVWLAAAQTFRTEHAGCPACHFRIGDSAATMRLLCGDELADSVWTQNPHEVTCQPCLTLMAVPLG